MTDPRKPSPPPAPDDLRLVQSFVNTAGREDGSEELTSPEALAEHLEGLRLLPRGTRLTQDDLERAIEVREVLRSLVLANSGVPLSEEAVAQLRRVAPTVPVALRLETDGRVRFRSSADGFEGALGELFEIVAKAQLTGLWTRFRACADTTCQRLFYDSSSRGNGKWCLPRCGVRIRARRRRRRRGAAERPKARKRVSR